MLIGISYVTASTQSAISQGISLSIGLVLIAIYFFFQIIVPEIDEEKDAITQIR